MRYQLTWESFPYFPINSYNPNNNSKTKFENSEFSLKTRNTYPIVQDLIQLTYPSAKTFIPVNVGKLIFSSHFSN